MTGLYIHIPFCESRCIYCGFYSTTSLSLRDDYVNALCKEMKMRPLSRIPSGKEKLSTIYLGGGTPSQLTGQQLQSLFEGIEKAYGKLSTHEKDMEITMECNPDDITEDFCRFLHLLPVNRISMGAQTFNDSRLKFLHRRHTAQEVANAVKQLRNIGIENISIDLMFGFPNESLADWTSDIQQAIHLGVEHISAYSLMYEEGTSLYKLREKGRCEEIDEELSRKMYDTLIEQLSNAGYEHYEISNFARPGFRSQHNSSYWHEVPYIGIGAAAHSYQGNIRSWNIANVSQYIKAIHQGVLPSEQEFLDTNTRYNDLITTALRTCDGIDLAKTKKEYGTLLYNQMLKDAANEISLGFMKIKDGHLSLTREGLYISDDIMSNFMIIED